MLSTDTAPVCLSQSLSSAFFEPPYWNFNSRPLQTTPLPVLLCFKPFSLLPSPSFLLFLYFLRLEWKTSCSWNIYWSLKLFFYSRFTVHLLVFQLSCVSSGNPVLSSGSPGHLAGWPLSSGHIVFWLVTGVLEVKSLEILTHGRRNFKDTNPLMSSLLVIFVWGGEAIL